MRRDLEVIDKNTEALRTAECFEEVKAKHVELNSIVAAIIKVMNDIIGNKLPRSKAMKNPDTVSPSPDFLVTERRASGARTDDKPFNQQPSHRGSWFKEDSQNVCLGIVQW